MSLSPISNYAASSQASPVADSPTPTRRTHEQADPIANPVPPGATALKTAVNQVAAIDEISPTKSKADNTKLDQAVSAINKFLAPIASSIEFSIDEESGRTLVKVVDTDTNTVLRQFPSKEALDISHQLDKLQGLLLKEKA